MVQIFEGFPSTGEKLAQASQGIAQTVGQQLQERQQSSEAKSMFEELAKDNPNVKMYRNMSKLWGSKLPFEQKKALAEALFQKDPMQAQRMQLDSMSGHIQRQIKSRQDYLKMGGVRPEEKQKIRDEIKDLINQQDSLNVVKDVYFEEPTKEEEPEEEVGPAVQEESAEVTAEEKPSFFQRPGKGKGKPKFNPENEGHKNKALQLKKAGKTKEQIRKILENEFSF